MNKSRIRAAAPELLVAAKAALGLLIEDPIDAHRRPVVVRKLRSAIDLAEAASLDEAASITLITTHPTSKIIHELVKLTDDGTPTAKALRQAVTTGTRATKQRVYIRVDAELPVLRRLKSVFENANVRNSKKALDRLAVQIEKEFLSKTPLEQLASMGL